jgi:hypothetical protein
VWVKAWVINALAGDPYIDIRITKYNVQGEIKEKVENLKCPVDGSWLTLSIKDTLPPDVPLWKCDKCNCWWLPGNSVFDLGEAFRVKAEFTKRWRKNKPAVSLFMPVVLTVILGIGLGVIVAMIRNQQEVNISARSVVVGMPTVIFLGNSKAEIRFRTAGDLQSAMIKREKDSGWTSAYVMDEGDWKVIMVNGIKLGEKIWVSLDLQVWQLTIGQKQ